MPMAATTPNGAQVHVGQPRLVCSTPETTIPRIRNPPGATMTSAEKLEVARALARGLPAMIAYQLVIRALLVGTVLLYPLVPSRLAFLNEVILLERGRFGSVVRRCLSAKERSSTSRLPTSRDYCTLPVCVFFPSVFSNQWWA